MLITESMEEEEKYLPNYLVKLTRSYKGTKLEAITPQLKSSTKYANKG